MVHTAATARKLFEKSFRVRAPVSPHLTQHVHSFIEGEEGGGVTRAREKVGGGGGGYKLYIIPKIVKFLVRF